MSCEVKNPKQRKRTTLAEYSNLLRQWQFQCHMCSTMGLSQQAMPVYTSGYFAGQMSQYPNSAQHSRPSNNRTSNIQNNQPPEQRQVLAQEFIIPTIWKRIAAELIDFSILFFIKILITYILVEELGLVSIKKYDINSLLKKMEIDFEKSMDVTRQFMTEIVIMEVINRICVSVFETICLRGSIDNLGGATPGKWFMRIKVVSCEDVISLGGRRVRLVSSQNGLNIGFLNSLARAIIKNFSMAFFFPICATVFFFQHGRAAYDILSSSIVVEGSIINPIRRQEFMMR